MDFGSAAARIKGVDGLLSSSDDFNSRAFIIIAYIKRRFSSSLSTKQEEKIKCHYPLWAVWSYGPITRDPGRVPSAQKSVPFDTYANETRDFLFFLSVLCVLADLLWNVGALKGGARDLIWASPPWRVQTIGWEEPRRLFFFFFFSLARLSHHHLITDARQRRRPPKERNAARCRNASLSDIYEINTTS